jgi:putative methylase
MAKAEHKQKKMTKTALAIFLSKLAVPAKPDVKLEQYATDADAAAEVLWNAYMLGDIEGKMIADLGAGTGILGIGALLLGAKHCTFAEIDAASIELLRQNLKTAGIASREYSIFCGDIAGFAEAADMVLQNPPFGTKTEHADRVFLDKAFSVADVVYSFHKSSTKDFIFKYAAQSGFSVSNEFPILLPLKKTQKFHTRKIHRIEVSCFRIVRKN